MAINPLDQSVHAIDRLIQIKVWINGQLLSGGLASGSNIKGVSVGYDIEQMPPTAEITMVDIPAWVERKHTVEIDVGYDGEFERIFTGQVKRRRHGVGGDTLDCVGRTAVLTRPYRVLPKSWTSQTAVVAIEDILDDLDPPFVPSQIDPIIEDDGSNWTIGTQVPIFLDSMSPSDMIRKIADVYGHRAFELKSGMLRIRPLLEAPAPTGFRTFSTRDTEPSRIATTTLSFDDSNIDADRNLGEVAGNTRRAQGFTPAVSGSAVRVSFWVQKIASPTDRLTFTIEEDDGAGEPNGTVLGGGAFYPGSTLLVGTYTRVDVVITTATELTSGTVYHLIVDRTAAVDAVNYYQVGFDTGAGYADGIANVYDGAAWAADAGDHPFEVVIDVFPTLRVINISDDEDEDQVKKEVIVRGATLPGTDAEGNEIQTQITATRFTESDDLVLGDRSLYSMIYTSELIQVQSVADEVAQRLVDKYHRVLQTIEVEIPFDPRIDIAQTVTIDDPEVTGLGGNWWIRGYSHSLGENNATTQLSLYGGDQSGTASIAPPQADFTFRIERELIGNAIHAIVTFFDASSDQDGWIVDYHWVDDYAGGVNDVQGADFRAVTFAYDPTVDPSVNMTLTVTDNDGNETSITKAIDTTENNEEAYTPVISCAAGNICMVTFDGGLSWQDIATPDGDARATALTYDPDNMDDEMIVLFGTTTGRIYRSIDGMATLVLVHDEGSAHPIVSMKANEMIRDELWALTSTGRVLRSNDWGATWALRTDLVLNPPGRFADSPLAGTPLSVLPCNAIAIGYPNTSYIQVVGGHGDDPESWVIFHNSTGDPDRWWVNIHSGDGVADPTGDPNDTVIEAIRSNVGAKDAGVLFSGRNPPYMYATESGAELANWQDSTGLPAVDGVSVDANNARLGLFGLVLDNKNFYRTQDGRTFEALAGVLPGTGANRPHHLLNIWEWRDIYLVATDEGIGKSIDYGDTWDFLRPQGAPINTTWPGGAVGYQIAFQYRRPRGFNLMAIVTSNAGDATAETAFATRQGGASNWTDRGPLPTGRDTDPHRLFHWPQINDGTVFFIRYTNATGDHDEDLYRSIDLGGAWAVVLTRAGAMDRGPDGRLWATHEPHAGGHALGHRQHDIYFSDDDGATWTASYVNANTPNQFLSIKVDPTNPNRVMALGLGVGASAATPVLAVSEDATLGAAASWSRIESPTGLTNKSGPAPNDTGQMLIAGENGRWITGYQTAATLFMHVWTSDNNGALWTQRYERTIVAAPQGFGTAIRMGNRLLFGGSGQGGSNGIPVISDDNGQTWQDLPNVGGLRSAAWLPDFDLLVVGLEQEAIEKLRWMQPPAAGGTWLSGLTATLDADMGYTANSRINVHGLNVIAT